MLGRWGRSVCVLVLAFAVAAAGPGVAETAAEVDRLAAEVMRLYRAGKYDEAVPLAQRALALRETALGPRHPDLAVLLGNLAGLYQRLYRYDEAESLLKRTLEINEKALGQDHPQVAASAVSLGNHYHMLGRTGEAEPLYKRSLAIWEKVGGLNHPEVAKSLRVLSNLYSGQARYAEAERTVKRELDIVEKTVGPEHPDFASALSGLAVNFFSQQRYAEAEPLFKRSLSILEKALGPDHVRVGTALDNLGALYFEQRRYMEAEPLLKRGLAIRERISDPVDATIGHSLGNLAGLYRSQGRFDEAEQLIRRKLVLIEKVAGPDNLWTGIALRQLGTLHLDQGSFASAEELLKRSLAVLEKALGPDHPSVGAGLSLLASLAVAQRNPTRAAEHWRRAAALVQRQVERGIRDASQSSPAEEARKYGWYFDGLVKATHRMWLAAPRSTASSSQGIARVAVAPVTGAPNEVGEKLIQQFAEAAEKKRIALVGPGDPFDFGNRGYLVATRDKSGVKLAYVWDVLDHSGKRVKRIHDEVTAPADAASKDLWRSVTPQVTQAIADKLAEALAAIAGNAGKPTVATENLPTLAAEMFATAQWSRGSEAAASLAQMAARSASGKPELAALVRERQDLAAEWQGADKQLIAARSEPPARRSAPAEKSLSDRLSAVEQRLAAIDMRLAKDFSDYAALASPKPVSVVEVQASLRDDEALLLFLDTIEYKPLPEETFVWVVTKREVRWLRSDLGTEALRREVAALRCGLDAIAWSKDGACLELTGAAFSDADLAAGKPLPFDAARAHALYKGLLGEAADLIKGKHLLIVPSGALTTLPFHVLVTAPPSPRTASAWGEGQGEGPPQSAAAAARGDETAWLIRDHAITVLPSVASLTALRRTGRPSVAAKAMIGFGNPLLDGDQKHPRLGTTFKALAAEAKAQSGCAASRSQRTASLRTFSRSASPVPQAAGLADSAHLKMQAPLPETADELCDVARAIGAEADDIRIGARATESEVKRLSVSGALTGYRMLHFATHGLLAGQLDGTREPGLILTPPERPTAEDDGYLSASEIAALKLDADWVVLSACNTAGGSGQGEAAEALSGLARVFFYAGARALLVSHWEVDSDAAVKLVTGAIGEIANDKALGRAEALRRAMLAVMADGSRPAGWVPAWHPSVWAPFVVVGEGAARK